ncbi:MAG: hypothetical protein ACLR5M_00885, partial [Bifidobacterium longum]
YLAASGGWHCSALTAGPCPSFDDSRNEGALSPRAARSVIAGQACWLIATVAYRIIGYHSLSPATKPGFLFAIIVFPSIANSTKRWQSA